MNDYLKSKDGYKCMVMRHLVWHKKEDQENNKNLLGECNLVIPTRCQDNNTLFLTLCNVFNFVSADTNNILWDKEERLLSIEVWRFEAGGLTGKSPLSVTILASKDSDSEEVARMPNQENQKNIAGIKIEITNEIWNVDSLKKIDGKPLSSGTVVCQTPYQDIDTLFEGLNLLYPNCISTIYQKDKIVGWEFETPPTENNNLLRITVDIKMA